MTKIKITPKQAAVLCWYENAGPVGSEVRVDTGKMNAELGCGLDKIHRYRGVLVRKGVLRRVDIGVYVVAVPRSELTMAKPAPGGAQAGGRAAYQYNSRGKRLIPYAGAEYLE